MPNDATFNDIVTCLSFAEDGLTLGVGSLDCSIQIWNIGNPVARNLIDRKMNLLHILVGHDGAITGVCLSVKLDIAVSSSVDHFILIHTLTNGQLLRSIAHPSAMKWNNVWLMGINKGEILGYSKEDKKLRLYSSNGDELMKSSTDNIKSLAISENGETLITGGDNGMLSFRTLASSLNIVRKIRFDTASAISVIFFSQHHVIIGFENGDLGFLNEKNC